MKYRQYFNKDANNEPTHLVEILPDNPSLLSSFINRNQIINFANNIIAKRVKSHTTFDFKRDLNKKEILAIIAAVKNSDYPSLIINIRSHELNETIKNEILANNFSPNITFIFSNCTLNSNTIVINSKPMPSAIDSLPVKKKFGLEIKTLTPIQYIPDLTERLNTAVDKGNEQDVMFYLARGANPNPDAARNGNLALGGHYLHLAIYLFDIDKRLGGTASKSKLSWGKIFVSLLQYGASLEDKRREQTPLEYAQSIGCTELETVINDFIEQRNLEATLNNNNSNNNAVSNENTTTDPLNLKTSEQKPIITPDIFDAIIANDAAQKQLKVEPLKPEPIGFAKITKDNAEQEWLQTSQTMQAIEALSQFVKSHPPKTDKTSTTVEHLSEPVTPALTNAVATSPTQVASKITPGYAENNLFQQSAQTTEKPATIKKKNEGPQLA